MRHFRLYIIGAKNLIVEVDAKYIKGMLNEPDLQPNAAINWCIQGELVKLLENYNLPHIPISPYNSQANGVVEQGHFAIREAIVKACQGKIQDWPSKLKAALFADNITVRR